MIEFTVLGVPAPQGSKVANRFGGFREANPATGPWRAAVAWSASIEVTRRGMAGLPLLDGPLHVTARFYFPRPKSHYRTGKHAGELRPDAPVFHSSKPDADKLARALGDSLSGVLIRDDARIAEWSIVKLYGEPARAEIRVARLLEDAA